ncbi:MAG: hypothetical protein OSA43_02930, partial [Pirellulales bacterium]|nr:hypothetical protein [Pirellulales bacterium]
MTRQKNSGNNGTPLFRTANGKPQANGASHALEQDDRTGKKNARNDEYADRRQMAKNTVISIDDPIRMYLMQMGDISMLSRDEELEAAQRIEVTQKRYRTQLLASDYVLRGATDLLKKVKNGELRIDRTVE